MNKSLKKNYIYNLLYQVLIMIIPLVLTPYLSRILGAEKIGIYSFTTSILSYFVLFGCLGINLYGQREIAAVQNDNEKRSKVFIELVILKFIMIFISFILFAIINYDNDIYGIYYKILTIELFANAVDITWFYQGIEDFKKITIRNTIVRILSVVLIFLFVKNQKDLIIYFLVNVVANFISHLTLWLNIRKFICKISFKNLNVFYHFKHTILLFIPQIAIQIYTVLDKTMLGIMLNDMNEVGYYEQSQKIIRILLMVVASIGTIMLPRITNLFANNKHEEISEKIYKVFNIVSIIGFPMCFGLIAVAENFVPWFYGEGFQPIVNLLRVFSVLLLAIGFNNITGMQYLIPTKKQSKFTISVVIGAITNLILNYILIPYYRCFGAAIASVIVEILILVIHIIFLRNELNFKNILSSNLKYLLSSVIMFIPTFLLGKYLSPNIISTVIQVCVGGLVYLAILVISKDSILFEMIGFLRKTIQKRKV